MSMPALFEPSRPSVTWRSVTLGLAGVVLVCGLTPYNDYALNNTFLVGNNLPLGVVMLAFLFVLFVNAPLNRWAPEHALSAGELTIALSMTLVSCALPSSGLMRYFPPSLVGPLYHAQSRPEFLALAEAMNLPDWIFPRFEGDRPSQWMSDPVVVDYMRRSPRDAGVPWRAWIQPALTWGIFLFALYGALVCMCAIVRRQWMENERLPFPLAQIPLALVEEPRRGRMLNQTLRRRSFWVAFALVFLLHAWNGAAKYWPRYYPIIPVYYNLTSLMSEPPWSYVDQKLKDAAVFFTVVGVTYFLSSTVALSLWLFYILHQAYKVWLGVATGDPTVYGQQDQHIGGVLAYAVAVLWIGRHHWRLVASQAFRGVRRGEPRGRYLPYPVSFWGLVGCAVVMFAWLMVAGCTALGAGVMVVLLLLLFFMITRIIAETGLVHGQLQYPMYHPWVVSAIYGWSFPVSQKTFYFTSLLQSVHYDFREVAPVYATHAMKVADQTVFAGRGDAGEPALAARMGRQFIVLVFVALLVGYVVSFASTLWTEYTYAATRDVSARMPINDWGAHANSLGMIVGANEQYAKSNYHPRHSVAGHMGFGFGLTSLLAFLRLRYTWWPLHPIGYLMLGTFPGAHLWFSIFWGWVAKTLIVRFGGPKMYVGAKPFFLGLIVGESMAAGFWLVMGIVLNALNVPYRPVNIMPG
ncbi:MAG: DUF6785 family protein [Tepidisphaeraceae bacterium]